MAKWLHPMVLIFLVQTTNLESDDACQTHLSILKWPQITCTNIDSIYFQDFSRPLNRTHWIKCVNCSLINIDERTFNFAKNNISFLELQNNKIRNVKKFAFSKFFLLKLLNLRGNNIDYLEPNCFIGLKRLLHIDLSSNFIKILTNNIFSDIVNLDVLNLNKNQIFYVQPYAFAGLINLKYLYLNNNDLKKLEDRIFKHLTNLKILYLEHNRIIEIHQNAFLNLRHLNYLYLNNNSISYLVQYNFKPLTSLVDLQLRSNNLTEIQVSSFNGLKSLRSLYLGDNNISVVKPYGFIGLDSLEILDLVENNLKFIDFNYFDKIERLYILWLNENSITNFSINPKSEVQNSLAVLDLSFNNITVFDYNLLYSRIPNIKEILLANNSFSCDFFTNMYNFFQERNVTVCVTRSCSFNETDFFINSICTEDDLTTTDINNTTDFSTDCSQKFKSRIVLCLYIALLLVLFC